MTTEHVYSSQTPGSVNNDDGNGIVLGMVWKAAVDGDVIGGRVYVGTKPTTLKMGLYSISDESTGVLLKSADFVMGSVVNDSWNEVTFAASYAYTAGTTLVIAYYSSNRYSFLSGLFDSADVVNGNVRGLQKGNPFANGRFLFPASDLAFPTGNGNGAGYFADVSFVAGGGGTPVDGALAATLPHPLTSAIAGVMEPTGGIDATLPHLNGALSGTVTNPAPTEHVPTPGWYGLLGIVQEAASEYAAQRDAPPIACPNDGEPLETGPGGVLHCRYDGFRWP